MSSLRSLVRPPVRLAVLAGLFAAVPICSKAATTFWDPGATHGTGSGGAGTWDTTATNKVWSDGASTDNAWVNGNAAAFAGPGDLVTVNGAVTTAGLSFTGGGYLFSGAGVITLAANLIMNTPAGMTVEIDTTLNVTTNQSWSVAASNTLNVNGDVTGNGNVNVTGAGTAFIFSGNFAVNKFSVSGGATVNWGGSATLPSAGGFTGIGDATPGTFNLNAGDITTAAAVFLGNNTTGAMTLVSGSFTMTGTQGLVLGDGTSNNGNGTGTLTISGGLFTTGTGTGNFFLGNSGSGTGTINLEGGTLATNRLITRSSFSGSGGAGGSGTFNFNGGTLQATGSGLAMNGLTRANIRVAGAIIDTNGFNITILQALLHSNIAGDAALDGGLTKNGDGSLTLSAANSYTGPTTVYGGTLVVAGSITGTARMDVYGGLAGAGIITTASGVGGEVLLANGAHLAPGTSGAGTLTIRLNGSDMDISQALGDGNVGELAFDLAAPAASDRVTLSGGPLIIGTNGLHFDDFTFTNLAGFDPNGTYTLFGTNNPISGTLDASSTTGRVNGQLFQLQLADNNTDIVLVSIPEPASALVLLTGLGALLTRRRRRTSTV